MGRESYDLRVVSTGGDQYDFVTLKGADVQSYKLTTKRPSLPISSSAKAADAGGPYSVRDLDGDWVVPFEDWKGGDQQESFDAEGSVADRFKASECIDVSKRAQFKLAGLANYTAASTIANKTIAALGKVFVNFDPGGADPRDSIKYATASSSAPSTFSACTFTGTDPTSAINDFCTDGQYVYASTVGDGIWYGTDSAAFDKWSDNDMTHICYCGGYLYGATATQVGYFDSTAAPAHAFQEISSNAIVKPTMTGFGLVALGNWVYWGVTGGGTTRVYAAQYDPSQTPAAKRFEQFVELPAGFVGCALCAYMGVLYIGGYYQSGVTNVGQGAIYLATPSGASHLCTIGDVPETTADPSAFENDNRVRSIVAHSKHLWILTTRNVYRWSLEFGGLSHYCAVPSVVATSLAWDTNYACTALPTAASPVWAKTNSGTYSETITSNVLHLTTTGTTAYVYYKQTPSGGSALSSTVGTTMDFTVKAGTVRDADGYPLLIRLCDGTSEVRVEVVHYPTPPGAHYLRFSLQYWDGGSSAWADSYFANIDYATPNTTPIPTVDLQCRLTLKSGTAKLYINGSLGTQHSSCKANATQNVQFGCGRIDYAGSSSAVALDDIKWSNDGAFAPGDDTGPGDVNEISVSNGFAYIPIDGYGISYTKPMSPATSGWLETSESSFHMPTVIKTFRNVELIHDALQTNETITVDVYIDGDLVESKLLDDIDGATKSTIPLASDGYRIKLILTLETTNTTGSPVVRGASCRFLPEARIRHQFTLDCRYDTLNNFNEQWSDNPEDAIAFLNALAANQEVAAFTSQITSDFDGVIEQADFLPAEQSDQSPGVEGILQVTVLQL